MMTLLIATRNAHKVGEIQQILGRDFQCLSLAGLPGAPTAVEDAETFAGNAAKKVNSLTEWLTANPAKISAPAPVYVLADDSGLEVDALNGAPGVHSARFAASDPLDSANSPDAANNAKLFNLMKDMPVPRRTARFRCVLALAALKSSAQIFLFDGTCEGKIRETAAGAGGFGYDPLFVPDGFTQSFAELGEDVKNRISHRARALALLKNHFLKEAAARSLPA